MTPFTIDPDVARASTIDKRFYLDHDVWRSIASLRAAGSGSARSSWQLTRFVQSIQ